MFFCLYFLRGSGHAALTSETACSVGTRSASCLSLFCRGQARPGVSEDVSFDAGEDFFGNSLHSYENMLYRFDMEK